MQWVYQIFKAYIFKRLNLNNFYFFADSVEMKTQPAIGIIPLGMKGHEFLIGKLDRYKLNIDFTLV